MPKETPEERIAKANIKEANAQLKEALDKLRAKTVEELRNDEKKFLRARISYLTEDDKEKFASVLKVESKPDDPKSEPKLSYKGLQNKAKELGLKYVGVSREGLEKAIKEYNAKSR